jgi:hypothetical protein
MKYDLVVGPSDMGSGKIINLRNKWGNRYPFFLHTAAPEVFFDKHDGSLKRVDWLCKVSRYYPDSGCIGKDYRFIIIEDCHTNQKNKEDFENLENDIKWDVLEYYDIYEFYIRTECMRKGEPFDAYTSHKMISISRQTFNFEKEKNPGWVKNWGWQGR